MHRNPNLASEVTGWRLIAENAGRGPPIESVHGAQMASTGHRASILNSRVKEIGIGVDVRAGQVWVTQVFRDPSGSARGTTPSCRTVEEQPGTISIPSGVVRGNEWLLRASRNAGPPNHQFLNHQFLYGRVDLGDLPIAGDGNGNGRDTIGIVRGDEWHLRNPLTGGTAETVVRLR